MTVAVPWAPARMVTVEGPTVTEKLDTLIVMVTVCVIVVTFV